MPTYLLDTSVYCQRLKPRPLESVVRRWRELGDELMAISACCEAEILFGLEKKGSERLWTEYHAFLKDRLTLLPFASKEAACYARLRAQRAREGLPVADMDLQIAATAIANGLVLATLNARHFAGLAGLQVEDWRE